MLEDLVVQAKMTDSMQAPGEMEKQALARIWREALKAVPTDELEPCFYAAIAHDQHRTPRPQEVLAAWNRTLIAAPRETFQEVEAREEAAQGFKALMSGKDEMPLFVQIHRSIGRPVVCACKFKDGVRRAAMVTRIGSMERWVCASGECNFDIDATAESAVKAATVAPLLGSPIPEAAPATISATGTRAELLAEEAELDWKSCTPEQREDLGRIGRWCDFQRPTRIVTPVNFGQIWEEFQAKRVAA